MLRRSRGDRVAAGVAGGLGRYFNVDPVLFRVLFAVAAFFGGSGVLAYVLLWALMPEEGAEHAAIDGWLRGLRARNIPVWAAAVIGVLVLWALTLSWWRPATLVPLAVVAVLVAVFATRNARKAGGSPGSLGSSGPAGAPGAPTRPGVAAGAATTAYAPVDLTKPGDATTVEAGGVPPSRPGRAPGNCGRAPAPGVGDHLRAAVWWRCW